VPWWISQCVCKRRSSISSLSDGSGVVLIRLGIPVLVETFTRFALQGGGTPAPVAPTQHLVITGPQSFMSAIDLSCPSGDCTWPRTDPRKRKASGYGALLWIASTSSFWLMRSRRCVGHLSGVRHLLRQRVALVATLARLYVGVVLIDRECECPRGHRRRIVGVVYDHMCQQQCDQRIGYAGGLRPGNMSQIGRVAPISHCGISDPANVSCGSLPDIADGYIGSSSTPENSKWPNKTFVWTVTTFHNHYGRPPPRALATPEASACGTSLV